MSANLIEVLPDSLQDALSRLLLPGEQVLAKLKGAFKEGLVCTDHRVIILKGGFMTGQMFGANAYQQTYSAVAGVQVKYTIMSGYFELSAGGMQNTAKSYWSSDKNADPAKAPNCVSLNSKPQAEKFREAASLILSKVDEARRGGIGADAAKPQDGVLEALEKLGQLRGSGVLTDGEFAAKKAELLSRL